MLEGMGVRGWQNPREDDLPFSVDPFYWSAWAASGARRPCGGGHQPGPLPVCASAPAVVAILLDNEVGA